MKFAFILFSLLILLSCENNTTNNAPDSVKAPEWLLGKFKGEYVFDNF